MGNVVSNSSARDRATENVVNASQTMNNTFESLSTEENEDEQFHDTIEEDPIGDEEQARARAKEEEMTEFRQQLSLKREQRRQILARHRTEKEELEKSLESERRSKLELHETNKLLREILLKNNIEISEHLQGKQEQSELTNTIGQMKHEFELLKSNNNKLRKDLAESNNALQCAFSDIADLTAQNTESIKHIHALKEVVAVSKTMINLREQQLSELKNKLSEIEKSLADRETNILSTDLRQEYERQLQNIRTLRGLYEERARLSEVTRLGLVRELEEQKLLCQAETNKCKDLSAKVEDLEAAIDALHEKIENKNNEISTCQDETRGLKSEMSVVNKLFSQVLLGYQTNQDLDKLVHRLEENHGLLTHMAERENGSEASTALPKLLLELVSQVDDGEEIDKNESSDEVVADKDLQNTSAEDIEKNPFISTTPEEIVQNLPKVWRVLMELLSHQNVTDGSSNTTEKVTTCYKSVETKSGPVLVPSVSQTYIRLKDLIIEKLGLIKEVNRMKQLNGHLETRLEEQERRLCLVTTELSKTWHVVGRLRRHHHQLHTHEKILKYELQQKRKLLNELKEELEYCREKWMQAREKNTQTERDWRKLRAEFSSRKTKLSSPSLNNSAESGYSDERPSDDSSESYDESEYVTEPLLRCKKRNKKSFETILDSSTDFNLAAEREDPPSDMLDVADLPLDTQDESHSENFHKSDKACEETEDEICDINDSCIEDTCFIGQNYESSCSGEQIKKIANVTDNSGEIEENIGRPTSSTNGESTSLINPAEILDNNKLQNERLIKKDEKLGRLEKNSAALLKRTQDTAIFSEQINSTLDHLINRPTSEEISINSDRVITASTSNQENDISGLTLFEKERITETTNQQSDVMPAPNYDEISEVNSDMQHILLKDISHDINCSDEASIESTSSSSCSHYDALQTTSIDFKAILENVKRQNERLDKKDKRLRNLEEECSEVVKSITNTLNTGEAINQRLDTLHSNIDVESTQDTKLAETQKDSENLSTILGAVEPSTSTTTEIDHEARFAARDLRLKRLEEQTKSLVNKVNKTTSKGVKINYKLEELHNIYGSENSRAGTPSDDSEEISHKEEESQEE